MTLFACQGCHISHLEEDEVPLAASVEGEEENDAGRGVGEAGEVVVQEDVPVQLGRVEGQAEWN